MSRDVVGEGLHALFPAEFGRPMPAARGYIAPGRG